MSEFYNEAAALYADACAIAGKQAMADAATAMRQAMDLVTRAQRCNLRVTLLEQGVQLKDLGQALEREWEKAGWPKVSTPATSSHGHTPQPPLPGT